jgi:hypothetical protein
MPPPPSPCADRPLTNMDALVLTAHNMLPTTKTEFASRIIGLRPKISLSLPHIGILAAFASRYAEPVHAYSESGTWKSRDIDGKAVGIRTASSAARKMLSVRAEKQSSVGKEGRPAVGDASIAVDDVDMLVGRNKLHCRSSVFACLRGKVVEELSVLVSTRLSDAVPFSDESFGKSEFCTLEVPTVFSLPTVAGVCDVVVVVAEAIMPVFPKRATFA